MKYADSAFPTADPRISFFGFPKSLNFIAAVSSHSPHPRGAVPSREKKNPFPVV